MTKEMNKQRTKHQCVGDTNKIKIIDWTAKIMKETNDLLCKEWTPNLLENTLCIIAWGTNKKDVHYKLLPWLTGEQHHQLEFRVIGNKKRQWELVAFDGDQKHLFLSGEKKPTVLNKQDLELAIYAKCF